MVRLSALDRKALRDLARLWAQVLAIALVLACGVMAIVLAVGAYRSLDETRQTYYDRYRFGHVFAQVVRAPRNLGSQIGAIDGVGAVALRIVKPAIVDIEGMDIPASGLAVSIPVDGEPPVNRLYLRSGRLPQPGRTEEVALDERFARAHGFKLGDRFFAVLNGRKLKLTITAIVLSPEFIYALAPGDMVPDDRRYAVFFMGEFALESLFDMDSAFNDVALRLMRGASGERVKASLDLLLETYGGSGSYGRAEQNSHAFLDSELTQLYAMARVMPPVFLFVSAFLVNMILSRLISLEREQIGLLKACGYSSAAVAWHYAKMVIVIAVIGLVIGSAAGSYFGQALTRLYARFFSFPFLVFRESADLYLIAGAVSVAAALAGAAKAIWSAAELPPAVAMQPPAPARYRSLIHHSRSRMRLVSERSTMAIRNILHRPVRSFLTTLGVAMAVALLVTSQFAGDSLAYMIDTVFFRSERADARISFSKDMNPGVISDVRRLPGVISAEIFRTVPVILRNGHREKRIAITGRRENSQLSRVLDLEATAVPMPKQGIVLTDRLTEYLRLSTGSLVEVELIEHRHRIVKVPLVAIVESYVGLGAHMDIDALDRLAGNGPRASGAWIDVDAKRLGALQAALKNRPAAIGERWPPAEGASATVDAFMPGFLYTAFKQTPALGAISMQSMSRQKFRETIEENILVQMTVYVAIAVILAFGVLYNSARIQLSERARELASLRVLGFTRGEVFSVLLTELLFILAVAQPLGWLLGYLFALAVLTGFQTDLFRVPLILLPHTYAFASLVVLAAAAASILIVRRRVDRLDMIRVLKTRE